MINHTGQTVFQQRLANELPTIYQALQPYQPHLQAVAAESTFNWYWLVDGLQAAGFPLQLANPAKIQQYSGLKRTGDQSDARWLAEMLRLGILPTGYIYPPQQRAVRDMARRRMLVSQQATRTLLSLQSMVTRHTGRTVRGRGLEDWTLVELRDAFPEVANQETVAVLLELLQEQRRLQRTLEKNPHPQLPPSDRVLTKTLFAEEFCTRLSIVTMIRVTPLESVVRSMRLASHRNCRGV